MPVALPIEGQEMFGTLPDAVQSPNEEVDMFELVRGGAVRVHVADIVRFVTRAEPTLSTTTTTTTAATAAARLQQHTVFASDDLVCLTAWKHVPPFQFLPEGASKG